MTHLFVYGSLLSAIAHPMGVRLGREGRLLGPASIRGKLYRVSWWPGLVDAPAGSAEMVRGELYYLPQPEAAFRWLDEYEGIIRAQTTVTAEGDIERVVRSVLRADGVAQEAFVYLYRASVTGLEPIAGGHWAAVAPRWQGDV